MHLYVLRSRRLRSDRARDTYSESHEAAMFWQHISKCLGYVAIQHTCMSELDCFGFGYDYKADVMDLAIEYTSI